MADRVKGQVTDLTGSDSGPLRLGTAVTQHWSLVPCGCAAIGRCARVHAILATTRSLKSRKAELHRLGLSVRDLSPMSLAVISNSCHPDTGSPQDDSRYKVSLPYILKFKQVTLIKIIESSVSNSEVIHPFWSLRRQRD